jgi:NADPH:quinone reductase-like Zn-dependent oxidoreductase
MRAAVYSRYGPPDVVRVEEVETPVPKDDEVLIRVCATTVCAADWRVRKADPFAARLFNGLLRPKRVRILGMEFAGTVQSAGKAVTKFTVGDLVFGGTAMKFGTHAEYLCIPQSGLLAAKPTNTPLEEAAAFVFGGMTVLSFLNKAKILPGQRVLIYGASGSVGVFAVQLAKHFGAHVTAVCSTANLSLVKSLGADEVVDYTKDDFSRAGRVYDMIFDTVGKSGYWRSLRCLKPGGTYVLVAFLGRDWFLTNVLATLLGALWASLTGAAKLVSSPQRGELRDLVFLKELMESGTLKTVIDKRYPLAQIADAHRHAESGRKKGHVLILCEAVR